MQGILALQAIKRDISWMGGLGRFLKALMEPQAHPNLALSLHLQFWLGRTLALFNNSLAS